MHIPDGYLSPIVSIGLGVITVPTWAIATQRIKKVLNNRTVPLLAIFSAMSFTIMMFNVPVPGGRPPTAWAARSSQSCSGHGRPSSCVSVALVIQALFFGDGGVLAIFTNCLNMAIILPFVGLPHLPAGGRASAHPLHAKGLGGGHRRATWASPWPPSAWASSWASSRCLFTQNGHADVQPLHLQQAIPAMVAAHAFGASIVEALITALGVAYLQKRHPEYLTSLRPCRRAGRCG